MSKLSNSNKNQKNRLFLYFLEKVINFASYTYLIIIPNSKNGKSFNYRCRRCGHGSSAQSGPASGSV
ncbi:MAG: hypothetical protein EGP87_09510 [Paraprevotella clara]|nr:hypothetical protein [Paraprevotella clara]